MGTLRGKPDMKSILITGGAGFIGLNFILYFIKKYHKYFIVNLDKLTYASSLENLKELKEHQRHKFIEGDICNRDLVEYIFNEYNIRGVIHFAAESHVDNSIKEAEVFMRTNILGTFILLDIAKNYWMSRPFEYKDGYKNCRFHQISTDEVYGTLAETGFFTEGTPYAPNNPYSASKASSDMIVRSYHHTYGLDTVVSNCSNNYGPRQHDEKLIPTIIRKALSFQPIPIYGDGKNIRDWFYITDHCTAIDVVFHQGAAGETYNIGGRNERDNLSVANKICEILDELKPRKDGRKYKELITFIKDRPGHDKRYAIDPTKIETELGWKVVCHFEKGLLETVKWYLNRYG